MRGLLLYSLTENLFSQLVGRAKMYPYLPRDKRKTIMELQMVDSQLNLGVKDCYRDKSFCRNNDSEIDLWKLYNLFTGASKTNHIDTFIDPTVNARTFMGQVKECKENHTDFRYINVR